MTLDGAPLDSNRVHLDSERLPGVHEVHVLLGSHVLGSVVTHSA